MNPLSREDIQDLRIRELKETVDLIAQTLYAMNCEDFHHYEERPGAKVWNLSATPGVNVEALRESVDNLQSLYAVASAAEELAKDAWERCLDLERELKKVAKQSYINSGEYEP